MRFRSFLFWFAALAVLAVVANAQISGGGASLSSYSQVTKLWGGTCSSTTFLRGDGNCETPSGTFSYPGAGVVVSTGSAWGTSLTAPTGALVGTSDTQTLTNKTLDGVTPTTMGYVDPTSSIQTQFNDLELAHGTAALGTSAISSGACASAVTVAATGVATTDVITFSPNTDASAVTGYAPSASGSLYIWPYPTAGDVNFKVCNNTASSITPGALTLNWKVVR